MNIIKKTRLTSSSIEWMIFRDASAIIIYVNVYVCICVRCTCTAMSIYELKWKIYDGKCWFMSSLHCQSILIERVKRIRHKLTKYNGHNPTVINKMLRSAFHFAWDEKQKAKSENNNSNDSNNSAARCDRQSSLLLLLFWHGLHTMEVGYIEVCIYGWPI